jgi:CheY-like chemotaxis protein
VQRLKMEDDMTDDPRGTVLCVDDDEAQRRALAWLFQEAGLEVEEAATGAEGLRLAARKPGLVVLDVNLPDIDGFEVCRRIKAHPGTAAIPVLHLSGTFVGSDDARRALAGGADGYLTKPVDPQVLVAWAKAFLRARSAEPDSPDARAPSPGGLPDAMADDLPDQLQASGDPHVEWDNAGSKGCSPIDFPSGHGVFRANGEGEDGDAFLGLGVALGIEACLVVLVMLPLCGVAVPSWAMLLTVAPILALLARCAWLSYRSGH